MNGPTTTSCFSATELEAQDLLVLNGDALYRPVQELEDNFPHNCWCYSLGRLLAAISSLKNCSASSMAAPIQDHPGGSSYGSSFWLPEEVVS